MDTFNPPQAPSIGLPENTKANVLETKFATFGQRLIWGLEATTKSMSLSWAMTTEETAQWFEDFFTAHAGQSFLYTIPGQPSPLVWSCKDWGRIHNVGTLKGFRADFKQEFDVG